MNRTLLYQCDTVAMLWMTCCVLCSILVFFFFFQFCCNCCVFVLRAVYREADIYLMDDPLSAVDSKVGRHLFDKCSIHFFLCLFHHHILMYAIRWLLILWVMRITQFCFKSCVFNVTCFRLPCTNQILLKVKCNENSRTRQKLLWASWKTLENRNIWDGNHIHIQWVFLQLSQGM